MFVLGVFLASVAVCVCFHDFFKKKLVFSSEKNKNIITCYMKSKVASKPK